MQAVYNYIPQTNQFSSIGSVAAFVYLQFVLLVVFPMLTVMLFYNSTFRSRCTLSNMVASL